MPRTLRLVLACIALVAHVGSAPSWLAAANAAAPDLPTESADCCAAGCEVPQDAPAPEPGDCCPDGCQHCPLSCCGGAPALINTFPTALDRPEASPVRLVLVAALHPTTNSGEIYHPPRS